MLLFNSIYLITEQFYSFVLTSYPTPGPSPWGEGSLTIQDHAAVAPLSPRGGGGVGSHVEGD
jgi:hypothetical protein